MTHEGKKTITPRERQVLVEIAMGYSAKEIAQRLDLAPRTVDKHVEMMILKLAARNRSHMIVLALHDRIISLTADQNRCAAVVPYDITARSPRPQETAYLHAVA